MTALLGGHGPDSPPWGRPLDACQNVRMRVGWRRSCVSNQRATKVNQFARCEFRGLLASPITIRGYRSPDTARNAAKLPFIRRQTFVLDRVPSLFQYRLLS